MFPKPIWPGLSAADACAQADNMQMGGFIQYEHQCLWFSERFLVSDFRDLGLPMRSDAQKDIACYETLAQMALLFVFSKWFPHQRMKIILPTVSDNTSAESGANKTFYNQWAPLLLSGETWPTVQYFKCRYGHFSHQWNWKWRSWPFKSLGFSLNHPLKVQRNRSHSHKFEGSMDDQIIRINSSSWSSP